MNSEEFRKQAKNTIDYICNYRDTFASRRVYPGDDVKVDYLKHLISGEWSEHCLFCFVCFVYFLCEPMLLWTEWRHSIFVVSIFAQVRRRCMEKILIGFSMTSTRKLCQALCIGIIQASLPIFHREAHIHQYWVICWVRVWIKSDSHG